VRLVATNENNVELTAPDISDWRQGNVGIDYAWRIDSGKPGPNVLVTASVHGNELCGVIALDFLRRENIRPTNGALTLAVCNWRAYQRFDPANPTVSRFVDEDFNRVWGEDVLDGTRDSVETRRARELRPLVDQADFLLDIHSMQRRSPPLMLCGPLEKGRRFALEVGYPATIVSDQGHAAGKRMRDYGGFGEPASPKNALLVECGQHWEAASADVARETMLRFLAMLGVLDAGVRQRYIAAPPREQARVVEVTDAVTIKSADFAFTKDYVGMEVIARAGSEIARDGGRPVVTPYDNCVLIMPTRRLQPGQTAVRLGRFANG
jgi:predicted deacylase